MKEYMTEHGYVNINPLKTKLMDEDNYKTAHQGLVLLCHDIFIHYNGGVLLVNRQKHPAKDILWPLGGRVKRGEHIEDSLREKVWDEANLELEGLTEMGYARTFFRTDPFGHGMGTDTMNFVYFSKGKGSLKLDDLHSDPTILTPKEYSFIKNELHPYVTDYMDLIVPILD